MMYNSHSYFQWLILSSRHLDFEIEQFSVGVMDKNQDGHVSEDEMPDNFCAIILSGAPSERDLEDLVSCQKRATQRE